MSNPYLYCSRDTQAQLNSEISYLAVVAAPAHSNPADTSQVINHWRIFAITGDRSSIVFDMSVGGDGQSGVLILQYKQYQLTKNAEATVFLSVQQGLTVQKLLSSVTDNKLERYRFTSSGDGCRNWIRNIVRFWEGQTLIGRGSAAKLDESILFVWTSNTTRHASTPGEGTFIG